MLPFEAALRPGLPIAEQVVYAAMRAIVSGKLQPGDRFPSVRSLSQELRINPNTSQRIVSSLVEQGMLEVQPGIGTVVAAPREGNRRERVLLIDEHVEPLVVEARRLGLVLGELVDLVREYWRRFDRAR
jgi:GntR family transcriptional regulator